MSTVLVFGMMTTAAASETDDLNITSFLESFSDGIKPFGHDAIHVEYIGEGVTLYHFENGLVLFEIAIPLELGMIDDIDGFMHDSLSIFDFNDFLITDYLICDIDEDDLEALAVSTIRVSRYFVWASGSVTFPPSSVHVTETRNGRVYAGNIPLVSWAIIGGPGIDGPVNLGWTTTYTGNIPFTGITQ